MLESGDSSASQPPSSRATHAESDFIRDAFVSYASSDAELAHAFVAALERHGLRCWIAPRDVAPGALYADVIIRAINGTKVLVVVLSQSAISSPHVGKEIERASAKQHPIIALRTDATPLTPALEYFLSESQWIESTAAGTEITSTKLVEAVQRLVARSPANLAAASGTLPASRTAAAPGTLRSRLPVVLFGMVAAALIIFVVHRQLEPSGHALKAATDSTPPGGAFHPRPATPGASGALPPPHSIAVLPFVNMSGDPKQDYFSDGLSEELLNSLAAVPDLQVAARTSSFMFKGRDMNVADIARKLNVGAVLEGSVRKDGSQVRITAQLINALTGFHLWSHTYDRDLKNVLALQTEIASAVTLALQATLMADAATTIEIGGTQNPKAFDAYLRGKNIARSRFDKENMLAQIAAFTEAIRLDPQFAKAYVGAANAQNSYANNYATGTEVRSWFKQARDNAEKAIALAPELGAAHASLAGVMERGFLDFARAQSEYDRALALAPNDVDVLLRSGNYFSTMGRTAAGLANIRRAIDLDQLNPEAYSRLGIALSYSHQYRAAIEAANRALQVDANDITVENFRGINELMLGDLTSARKSCDTAKQTWEGHLCMAILYDRFHQRREAQDELAAMQAELGESATYQYAEIYAQWGEIPKALDALERAFRLPDPGIGTLRVDEFVDPLRKEPRFLEIQRKLNFPN
jgi:TolB-like protein/Tfp pilus assembly protein PilF